MKSIYNISTGQLVAIWVLAFMGWFFTLSPALDYREGFAQFLMIFIPFALIFYTLGWRKFKKLNRA